ncbi:MAG: FeoA family protein [Phycisphaerales bacterium]|nr:FeoA family protein [Phycisphaerales bacterium]MDP6890840.1 FeoA family protein [Phycisphaerales bacterium]
MSTTTLDTLTPGDTATIAATAGDDAPLLRAMGLREGMDVTVKRTGEPCIVEAGNTRLGLARAMTGDIEVIPHT